MISENKKPRTMSPKGFLAKSNTKAANSAKGFIDQYRSWLTNGEVAAVTSPIIRQLDEGQLLPTPALEEIKKAVLGHMIAQDIVKVENSFDQQSKPKATKDWIATIFDSEGHIMTKKNTDGEEEDLVKSFDEPARCDDWVDRRLFDGASDWYGVVEHTKSKARSIINRADSLARILKRKKGPTINARKTSTKTLGWGAKVSQSRMSFSRG